MNPNSRILRLLQKRVLILDGAMGTELHKRGLPPGICPEAWCLDHPEAVGEIHAAYREAGADIVYTSTFGANRLKMGQFGLTNVRETNRFLAEIAVRAAGGGLVAGDIGPTGHFVEPFGDILFEDSVALFREQAQGLLEGGVDLFVIETMMDIQEARAALIAVRDISDLFCMVTMTYEKHGRTLNGTDPVSALVTLQSLGANAVGCNCSAGPEGMFELIAAMKPHATVPLVAKPNAGLPKLVGDATVFDLDAAGFAGFGGPLAAAGANLLGGCCGTTPAHIRALRDALTAVKPVTPRHRALAAASSTRNAVILEEGRSLTVVGGRLNAAENEAVRQGLLSGDPGPARQTARAQEKEGAQILLLKVGAAGVDETEATRQILEQLAPTTRSSFLLAAERVETVGQMLRFYPGRLLVHVAGEEASTALLPVIAKYGAIPVLCIATTGGMPADRAGVRKAITDARAHGFAKEEIVIDCTPPAQNPEALRAALGMIGWCAQSLGCRTLLDLTGVGKGLPEQPWLQASILAAAQALGLTLAVVDPGTAELMQICAAGNLLRGNSLNSKS
ncbi:MAG: homocysteine S-methyltransferase family protein [Deltaproteobacteria bacterium]|nr:homocysteine S-methyltransferase family protein [Deltaproteobacteria bacterium]